MGDTMQILMRIKHKNKWSTYSLVYIQIYIQMFKNSANDILKIYRSYICLSTSF